MRRLARALWPLALVATLLCTRATGCKKAPTVKGPTPRPQFTPRITNPPPGPTQTMPPGITRIPVAE